MMTKEDEKTPQKIKDEKEADLEMRRTAMEKRSKKKRELRQLHIERKEATEAARVQRDKEVAEAKARQHERMQRLAAELSCRKHFELQEFYKKQKERSTASMVTTEALGKIQTELCAPRKGEDILPSTLSCPWNYEEESEMKKHERKLNYKKDLQNQMIDNQRRFREKEEEKHRERKIMEEVGEVIHRENLEAEKAKKSTATLLQDERDAFLKARQIWKEKRREVLKQEFDEIARIIVEKEAQQKKDVEGKSDTRAAKDAVLEKLMAKLMDEERKRMEREELCRELYLAEKDDAMSKEMANQAVQKRRIARDLRQEMARNQRAIAERKAKDDAIDAAFAKYLADQRKIQEEAERIKEQTRRRNVVQYRNELREMMAEKVIQRAKEAEPMPMETGLFVTDEKRKVKCYSESTFQTFKSQEAKNDLYN